MNPSDMSNEQLRIAVAKALGWTYAKPAYSRVLNVHAVVGLDPDGERRTTPNWPADLNACHQFEKTLSRDQQQEPSRKSMAPPAGFGGTTMGISPWWLDMNAVLCTSR